MLVKILFIVVKFKMIILSTVYRLPPLLREELLLLYDEPLLREDPLYELREELLLLDGEL